MHNSQTESQIVIFRVSEDRYALPTETAREVITYVRPRRLPGSRAWVEGVINLRGEIIPVCDLSLALGLEVSEDRGQIVICDTATDSVGLIVDEVLAVTTIDLTEVSEPASMSHPAMSGVIELDGSLVMLLSLDAAVSGWALNASDSQELDAA